MVGNAVIRKEFKSLTHYGYICKIIKDVDETAAAEAIAATIVVIVIADAAIRGNHSLIC